MFLTALFLINALKIMKRKTKLKRKHVQVIEEFKAKLQKNSIVIEVSNPLFLFFRCKTHQKTTKKHVYK